MAQFFKGDARELQFYNSGKPTTDLVQDEKDSFFEDAFECYLLGDLLHDNQISPLANGIDRLVFRQSFSAIYESFITVGTFEAYLLVFSKIFGDDVEVEFDVPAPGKLNIGIQAVGLDTFNFAVRRIVDNQYLVDRIITQAEDVLVFRSFKGIDSQYELEQLLFEMVPQGIYTEITLTLGED